MKRVLALAALVAGCAAASPAAPERPLTEVDVSSATLHCLLQGKALVRVRLNEQGEVVAVLCAIVTRAGDRGA